MKYTLQSCKYVLKNFIYVFPFAVLPALFLSVSTDESALIFVFENFFSGNVNAWDFSNLFRAVSVLNFASWEAVAFGFVGIIAVIFCVSLMMALMEKHMRIGKRTFNGIFSKINDNLLSTSGYVFLLFVIYEFWSLITAALLYFVSRITITALAYIFIVVVFFAMHFALLYCIDLIYLWLPCMQITGFRAAEALYYSNQLSAPVKWHLLLGQTLSLLSVETLICFCTLFAPDPVSFTIFSTALYALLIVVYCVRMQIAYFDLDHIERADLVKYYQR
ncbi:MAG: hypothetical protein IJX96_02960 [Clostridia bacterium]|nr:hypothetical protein [Clostridia bacterium]